MATYDMIISYSEMKDYRACRQKHHFKYVQGLRPRAKDYRLALGDVVHGLLEAYAREEDIAPVVEEYNKQYSRMFEDEVEKDVVPNAVRIYEGYVRRYKKFPLKYTHIEENMGPVTLVEKPHIGLKFRADGVVIDGNNEHWLLERKTRGKFRDQGYMLKDLQTSLYTWALRELGIPAVGVLWDEIRTKLPVQPEVLRRGGLSKRKNIDTDRYTYLKAIKEHGLKKADYKDMLEILKNKKYSFYRRVPIPTRDSTMERIVRDARATALEMHRDKKKRPIMELGFTCNFCEFQKLCEAKLDGLDTSFMIKADFTRRERGNKKKTTGS